MSILHFFVSFWTYFKRKVIFALDSVNIFLVLNPFWGICNLFILYNSSFRKINFGDKQVKKYGKKLAALFYDKKKSKKNYKTQATVNRSIEKKAVSAGKKLFKAAVATLESCPCKKYPQSELVKIPKPLQEKLRKATEAVQVGAGEMNFFVQKIKCIRQHGKNCNMANTAKEHYQRNGPMDLQKGIDGGIGGRIT